MTKKRKLTTTEVDELVIRDADDDSAWGPPIHVPAKPSAAKRVVAKVLGSRSHNEQTGATMASSKCAKCDSHSFEMKEGAPTGSQYKIMFIQCSSCGTVVGVTDYFNVPFLLEKIGNALGLKIL